MNMSKSAKGMKSTKNMQTPSVPKDAKSDNKYSTNGAGRATPALMTKKKTKPSNP